MAIVSIRDGEAFERMEGAVRAGLKPDFTVTDAKVAVIRQNFMRIEWGTVSAGFARWWRADR